jgi:hypothetical protein
MLGSVTFVATLNVERTVAEYATQSPPVQPSQPVPGRPRSRTSDHLLLEKSASVSPRSSTGPPKLTTLAGAGPFPDNPNSKLAGAASKKGLALTASCTGVCELCLAGWALDVLFIFMLQTFWHPLVFANDINKELFRAKIEAYRHSTQSRSAIQGSFTIEIFQGSWSSSMS